MTDRERRLLIQTRALENQVFLVDCNLNGASPKLGMDFPRESAIVDPFGRTVVDCAAGGKVVCGNLDLGFIEESRVDFDYLNERRPQTYALGR